MTKAVDPIEKTSTPSFYIIDPLVEEGFIAESIAYEADNILGACSLEKKEKTSIERIFVSPWRKEELGSRLFEKKGHWSPPGSKWIWEMFRDQCEELGIKVKTADLYDGDPRGVAFIASSKIFYTFRLWDHYAELMKSDCVRKRVLLQGEPIVISPNMYVNLERLGRLFTNLYYPCRIGKTILRSQVLRQLFLNRNLDSVGYFSLAGTVVEGGIIEELFNQDRRDMLVMIQGNKFPVIPFQDLYGLRIGAINYFGHVSGFSLYGKNWDSITVYPRLLNWKAVKNCYRGTIPFGKKFDFLAMSKFCLCFENSAMNGYVTERIFDAFAVGTIPIYLGAPDISDFVPKGCFIDFREFGNFKALHKYLLGLSESDIQMYKKRILAFINSERFLPYTLEAQARRMIGYVFQH